MARTIRAHLDPRKSPVQERSSASVDAILEATVQVLLTVGRDGLTTRRVADRAGVSVGTLYQYFPNKASLLQTALRRHLEAVADTVQHVCQEQHARPLGEIGEALVCAFLEAKMKHVAESVALYQVSSDVDGMRIAQEISIRVNAAIEQMLTASCESLAKPPETVAAILGGVLAGVSRRLLETASPELILPTFRAEMIDLVRSYLATCKTAGANQPVSTGAESNLQQICSSSGCQESARIEKTAVFARRLER